MKNAVDSKTIWAGASITSISVIALMVEIWGLLDYEQLALIDRAFGAGTTALIGILMIVLRVVTTQPLGRESADYNAGYDAED